MRKSIYLTCLLISVLICAAVRSQEITLNRDGASLQDLFLEIHHQTGYFFYYSNKDLSGAKPVTIHVNKAPLEEVLNLCFAGQPLVYKLDNKTIVVRKKAAQNETLTDARGRVVNEEGDLLENASVELQGTSRAVSTNSAGGFLFEKVPDESILQISHVGYASQTIEVKQLNYLIVVLKRSVSKLDEVQVIAYGLTTRRLNTGDVGTVTHEMIEQQPVSNPLEALEGRVPGVYISQQTGLPGGAINIQIRGQNSLRTDGNNPLYVIDGVPYTSTSIASYYTSNIILGGNPLNEINPSDIERVDILKDADATAIYGSRGSNGVVLITTKKGIAGKTTGTINASTGFSQVGHMMPVLNTAQYLAMRHEAFLNDGAVPGPSDFDLNQWDTTRNTNWEKVLIGGSAPVSDLNASLSGGSSNTQFSLGAGFHQQGTVFPGNLSDKKISAHLYLNQLSSNGKFNVTLTASCLNDYNRLISQDLTSFGLTIPPDAPPAHDEAGNLVWGPGYFQNPYAYLLQNYYNQTSNLISNLQMGYALLNHLQLKLNAGYNSIQSDEKTTDPVAAYNPAFGVTNGDAVFAHSSIKSWILEPQILYSNSWKKLNLQALAGGSFQENSSEAQSLFGYGYSSDLLLGTLAGAGSIYLFNASNTEYRYQAFFGRVSAQWGNKYLVNLSARRDGSSRFGPGRQYGEFGSAGLGWIFSKERLISDHLGVLSFGKLRGSYGSTGSDQIGDYGYLSTYSPTSYPYQGITGLYPTNLFNADYSWEITRKLELGLDLGFWHDRLLMTMLAYRNRSSNQLVGLPLPIITGFSSIQANFPATVQNQGLEFEINTINIKGANLNWKTSINLTIPQNKLLDYPNLKGSDYANLYTIGKSLTTYKAFQFSGVNAESGVYEYRSVAQNNQTISPQYPDDLSSFQTIKQDYYGGMLNQLQYKGIQLDIFFQFVHQSGINFRSGVFQMPGRFGNQPDYVLRHWQKPGDEAPFQKYSQDFGGDARQAFSNITSSDLAVSDASFIRLKNISLSWSFPPSWMRGVHMQDGKIFFRAQNLFTITHYQGLDPETQSTRLLPPLRTIVLGIQITI